MTHKEKARELFLSGYNCAQSVFVAFCDVTGMSEMAALRLASSFGGGMGGLREVCGACSGIFMAAGMLYGYSEINSDTKKAHYELIQQLAETFKTKNQSIICRELLDMQGATYSPVPGERTDDYYKSRPCLKYVEDAVEIFDELMEVRTMRIAVTFENEQIFQHFGHTERFAVYDVDKGKVVTKTIVNTNGSGHGALADILKKISVDVLICGGIGGGAKTALAEAGIKLYPGVTGSTDDAVHAFLSDNLNFNPDTECDHHGHEHHWDHDCGNHTCS